MYFIYVVVIIFKLFKDKITPKKIKDVDSGQLVNDVFIWCTYNIQPVVKRKCLPKYRILYETKGTTLGYYDYQTKIITIYPNKHDTLESLVDSCIHEYVHHLQIRNSSDNARYKKMSRMKSYYGNEYEIEARKVASENSRKCMRDLGLI